MCLRTQHLAKETLSGLSILAPLDEDLNEIAILVDSAPKITTLALDRDDHFVKEPTIAPWSLAFPNAPSVVGPERAAPLTDSLVRDRDATLGQEVFDIAEAQREAMVEPHRSRDDFGRESVSAVVRGLSHARIVGYLPST